MRQFAGSDYSRAVGIEERKARLRRSHFSVVKLRRGMSVLDVDYRYQLEPKAYPLLFFRVAQSWGPEANLTTVVAIHRELIYKYGGGPGGGCSKPAQELRGTGVAETFGNPKTKRP